MSPHNLDYDSASSGSSEKRCKGCGHLRPLTSFSISANMADGLRAKCKECIASADKAYYQSRSRDADVDEPSAKRPKLEPTIPGEHLYIMAISTDPEGMLHGLKWGAQATSPDVLMKWGTLCRSTCSCLRPSRGKGTLKSRCTPCLTLIAMEVVEGGSGSALHFIPS